MASGTEHQVLNHDVVGLHERINRFIIELQKSQSSNVSHMNSFDQARLGKYLTAIDTYHGWVTGQPQLDLPETTPRIYVLEDDPEILDTESEEVNDVVRLLCLARDELVGSQSSRQGSGLIGFDSGRLTAIVAKARAFLKGYIADITPLDQPESSPREVSTGPGSTGTGTL